MLQPTVPHLAGKALLRLLRHRLRSVRRAMEKAPKNFHNRTFQHQEGRLISIHQRRRGGKNYDLNILLFKQFSTCRFEQRADRTHKHRMAFGGSYHDVGSRFKTILNEAQAMLGGFFFADYLPIIGWVDWLAGMRARLEKNFVDLDQFYQQVLDEHLDRAQQQQNDDSSEDLVDILLRMQKDEKSLATDQIKGAVMNVFIAGSDTSSATVVWAMTELMRHPQAMKKAQEEVRSLVGSKGKVEESDIDQLRYLKCVVKETMRLQPVAPMLIPRTTLQHFKINSYDVPSNTTILINAWAIGRDSSYWESPEVLKPKRFMNNSDLEFAGKDFNSIPFGEGRRICPGKHLRIKTVEIMLANLLYSFDWELPMGMTKEDTNMDEAPGVTVHKRHELRLLATRYSGVYS